MSTLEIREANEALGDLGESRGCPGEGRGLLCLHCFGLVFDSRDQVIILHLGHFGQLHAAIPILTGTAVAHYLAPFTMKLVGNRDFLSREGFDKPAQAYSLSPKIF